jgi:hypothetical protein
LAEDVSEPYLDPHQTLNTMRGLPAGLSAVSLATSAVAISAAWLSAGSKTLAQAQLIFTRR